MNVNVQQVVVGLRIYLYIACSVFVLRGPTKVNYCRLCLMFSLDMIYNTHEEHQRDLLMPDTT